MFWLAVHYWVFSGFLEGSWAADLFATVQHKILRLIINTLLKRASPSVFSKAVAFHFIECLLLTVVEDDLDLLVWPSWNFHICFYFQGILRNLYFTFKFFTSEFSVWSTSTTDWNRIERQEGKKTKLIYSYQGETNSFSQPRELPLSSPVVEGPWVSALQVNASSPELFHPSERGVKCMSIVSKLPGFPLNSVPGFHKPRDIFVISTSFSLLYPANHV